MKRLVIGWDEGCPPTKPSSKGDVTGLFDDWEWRVHIQVGLVFSSFSFIVIYEGCPIKNETDFFTGIIYSPSSMSVWSFSKYSPWASMHLSHRFCQSSITCVNPFLDVSFRIASVTLTTALSSQKDVFLAVLS